MKPRICSSCTLPGKWLLKYRNRRMGIRWVILDDWNGCIVALNVLYLCDLVCRTPEEI